MKHDIKLPINDEDLRKLKAGDIVFISGIIITARDQAHKRILELVKNKKKLPDSFKLIKSGAIYHCGPIIKECNGKYELISGGPTTSQRMDSVENEVVSVLGAKFVIGKGGMKNLNTKENNVVYLSFTGGCGAIVNQKVEEVLQVEWKDLGTCEAVWFLKVNKFGPLIVGIDVFGNNLYKLK